jgi:hypothetical protein
MTRTRLALWGVLGSLVLLSLWFRPDPPSTAWAQGVGIYSRASCSSANLSNAVSGQTWCFETSSRVLTVWDGAAFVPLTATISGANIVLPIGGQTNFANILYFPVATGTNQQIALGATIAGRATGTAANRMAGYFGSQTSDTGTDSVLGVNVAVQQGANAYQTQIVGIELDLNSNKADATLDMNPTQAGMSVVSGGSRKAGIAYLASGGPQWIVAYQVDATSVATNGYAFRYKGDNIGGQPFTVDAKSNASGNTFNAASATYSNNVAIIVASGSSSNLTNIRGLSASSSKSNNLRGTCTFSASATCVVAFANNEPDSNYFILVGGIVNVSSKAVSGFTMTATGTNSNAVDWLLVR